MAIVTDASSDSLGRGGSATLRARLTAPGSRSWYIGGGTGLLWQGILVATVLLEPGPVAPKVIALALLAVLFAAFLVIGPVISPEPTRVKLLVIGAYWLASCLLFPLIGVAAVWVWLLVLALAALTGLALRYTLGISALVVLAQVAVAASVGFDIGTGIPFAPIVSAVVAATLVAASVNRSTNASLRRANGEIARLAVVEERARFGRDLHDVLGHTLTVVTVKSELARRLVAGDPAKAEAELADIEMLARSALADLRLAVANYREIALDTELIAANTALSAAGIAAHLPDTTGTVDPALGGTFAWVLREGVTNVIRHSGATHCWVTVGRDWLTIADDGRGRSADDLHGADGGNGLRGLRERAAEVGAHLETGRSRHSGFEVTVRRAA